MFEPIRGGTRGGQAEFKWSDVSADKDRENYLGHSINAPTGRWQKNKDVHWYNRELNDSESQRKEEIRKIKEAEAEALSAALGFAPEPKTTKAESLNEKDESKAGDPQQLAEKEERRRRKEEKRARKEAKREIKEAKKDAKWRDRDDYNQRKVHRTRHSDSRSRSPRHRDRDVSGYDSDERDRERRRARRRWDDNLRRDAPSGAPDGLRWPRGRED